MCTDQLVAPAGEKTPATAVIVTAGEVAVDSMGCVPIAAQLGAQGGVAGFATTPLEFLNDLWADKPEDQYILIWTLQDKWSRWFQKVPEAAAYVASITNKDVYVGVGLSGQDYGPKHRCVSHQITGICGLAADFDLASPAHPKKALPQTAEQALSIIPEELQPTIMVTTGNGIHCWWLFKEPYVFDNDQDRKEVAGQCTRFHTMLRIRAGQKKWAYDRLLDLARVLRIPGTTNLKDPTNPKAISVLSRTDRRHNFSDIVELLDELGIPDQEAQEEAKKVWAERFAYKPLVINLEARIPQEKLDAWMDADMRFRNTWNRQRHDLKDQSSSGYDMALADFGVDAGLTDQQIVDLIIHHRRIHGQKARTKLDYFHLAIIKANNRRGGVNPLSATPAGQLGQAQVPKDADGQGAPPQSDPEVTRALLLDRVSQALGVHVLRVTKVTGADPSYHIHLADGTVIECPGFAKFTSQDWVREAVGKVTNRLIPKFKPKLWEGLAQSMLDALVEQAGGDEVELNASSRLHLGRYLAETEFITSVDDLPVQAQQRPTILNGSIAITASDFQTYVNKAASQNLSVKMITSRLSALGAESVRPRSGNFRDQSRWLLPVQDFPPAQFFERIEEADSHGE